MALIVDIEKKFGDFTLRSNFETEGEILALLGASGCGKSVTLKCIAGIETPDKGMISLDGQVFFDSEKKINIPTRKRNLGYLFQNYALFPNMTVEENIGCSIVESKEERQKVVASYIKQFCLEDCLGKYAHQLSGGQQQRVALARMLVSNPKLIMLDEPFSALDDYLKWTLEQEIMNILEQFKGTVLFVSHNRDEVYRIADRIAVMEQGQMETVKSKKELFEDPKTLAGTLLTGCKNISRVKYVGDHQVFAIDWGIYLNTSQIVDKQSKYVGFRAHYFEEVEQMSATNVVACEISRVIESTFSMIIMFYHETGDQTRDYARLRYELSKEQWAKRDMEKKLYLKMPEHRLIFMS